MRCGGRRGRNRQRGAHLVREDICAAQRLGELVHGGPGELDPAPGAPQRSVGQPGVTDQASQWVEEWCHPASMTSARPARMGQATQVWVEPALRTGSRYGCASR